MVGQVRNYAVGLERRQWLWNLWKRPSQQGFRVGGHLIQSLYFREETEG